MWGFVSACLMQQWCTRMHFLKSRYITYILHIVPFSYKRRWKLAPPCSCHQVVMNLQLGSIPGAFRIQLADLVTKTKVLAAETGTLGWPLHPTGLGTLDCGQQAQTSRGLTLAPRICPGTPDWPWHHGLPSARPDGALRSHYQYNTRGLQLFSFRKFRVPPPNLLWRCLRVTLLRSFQDSFRATQATLNFQMICGSFESILDPFCFTWGSLYDLFGLFLFISFGLSYCILIWFQIEGFWILWKPRSEYHRLDGAYLMLHWQCVFTMTSKKHFSW